MAMHNALERLEKRAPLSPWRQKALVQAANEYLVTHEHREYVPLYQGCAADFAGQAETALCHWRLAWRAYISHQPQAVTLLREHLRQYPSSEKAGASLFYLGREAERANDMAGAWRYWREALQRFPNSYYGVLARGLTAKPAPAASPEVERFLQSVRWPKRETAPDFRPDGPAQRRIERARFLAASGLETWGEAELRFAARNGVNRWPLAMELARIATGRGAPPVAMRHIKGTVPEYLFLPREAAPIEFWKYAFPFPYRARIERHSRERGLDPFLVAALIRQESEFDPLAVSPAKAIGLMQVMPATGRALSRKLGIRPFSLARLKNPETSIQLGTYYLSQQLAARNGSVEDTLAGYNAGPSRVPKWRGWEDYREPSEFVETIPFQQTRDYVQIIQRNADIYRWLYANEPVAGEPEPRVAASPAPAAKKPAAKAATAKKKAAPKTKKKQ
jgi:soluble lytic murein transglycosylase